MPVESARKPEPIRSRSMETDRQYQLLDGSFPMPEQLPRHFEATFRQVMRNGRPYVSVLCEGKAFGDELTDNSYRDDGYRFHDIFHLGFAALLGWSPMTRKLFGRKRRSAPLIDEVEDGGRARVLEEAVCALIYDYARKRDYLARARSIEPELLDAIKSLTWDREVGARSKREWETAILRIYEVWRGVWTNEGGVVTADLSQRKLDYSAI